ncbi:DinB family protein, partial [Mesorhizobium sp. M8A.F.Ca.ET.167.01.1.1]|uniref:DinB family protein n=1 Tax=Mesorhizobium sp. M8A.F.Ca.ET.167.01.1.1 TaxID=2563961 RepID=UPI001093677F
HFMMFAAYNQSANGRLYEAAGDLGEDELGRDVGAVFGAMLGTLNHLLAVDRVWMKRFTGEGDAPSNTAAILYRALPALKQAREAEDKRIVDWLGGMSDKALAGRFSYMTTDMRTVSQRLAPALSHLFNHQTHHRGQAHMCLTVLGRASVP